MVLNTLSFSCKNISYKNHKRIWKDHGTQYYKYATKNFKSLGYTDVCFLKIMYPMFNKAVC